MPSTLPESGSLDSPGWLSQGNHGVMRTEWTHDVGAYLGVVQSFLEADPVVCSVLLTTPIGRGEPLDPATPNIWCWAELDGDVVAVAQHTPPFGVYVSPGEGEALASLAGLMHQLRPGVPSVGGVRRAVDAFTGAWPGRVGVELMATHLYACSAGDLVAPTVPGHLRLARSEDADILRTWVDGFVADTGVPAPVRTDVDERIAAGRLWVWQVDEQLVSMAGTQVPVGGVARVSLVYTPPEQRGRGWAAACTAGVTSLQHERGLTCMLYADAANPVSNGVYTRIGYRHVAEAVDRELLR
jgi:predicted GNAT family acetyltransferase